MKPRVEIAVDLRDRCGEAPIWDAARGRLIWTDIEGSILHVLEPGSGSLAALSPGRQVSGLALDRSGALVLAGPSGLHTWRESSDQQPRAIAAGENNEPLPFNDVIATPSGGLYAGAIHWGADGMICPGELHFFDPAGRTRIVDEGILLANGLAIGPEGRKLYFADSAARVIYVYDADPRSGELSDKRAFVRVPAEDGIPDGITLDAEGHLWCALWYGAQVVRYDPDGAVERRIRLPSLQISSLAFGGPDLDALYVTSAAEPWRSNLAPPGHDFDSPRTGGPLYRVWTGIQGRPEPTTALA